MLMEIGSRIRKSRAALGLSQSELAVRTGLGMATIQNIENNRANPSLKTLLEIFKVLKIKIILQESNVALDMELLSSLGCPLMGKATADLIPTQNRLVEAARNLACDQLQGRSKKAIAAWLAAIHDHFPSVWEFLPVTVRSWSANQSVDPKMRRLAVSRLSEFL